MIQSGKPWLIQESSARQFISDLRAGMYSHEKESEGLSIRAPGGIAIVRIEGVLFQKPNWMTEWGYGCDYESIYCAIAEAIEDPSVRSVLLYIDSPGGEASGVDELATSIRQMGAKKPIYSYVPSLAASGGYWIAAATSRIFATRMSFEGCIGCIAVYYDDRKLLEKIGVEEIVFVSSVSPDKFADPATDSGKAIIQKEVDAVGSIFVSAVSEFRGVTPEKVASDFGKGACLVAEEAQASGLIDEIANLNTVLDKMRDYPTGENTMSTARRPIGLKTQSGEEKDKSEYMDKEKETADEEKPTETEEEEVPAETQDEGEELNPEELDEDEKEAAAFMRSKPKAARRLMRYGVAQERKRIQEIEDTATDIAVSDEFLNKAKYESSMSAGEFALKAIKASKKNKASHLRDLNRDGEIEPINSTSKPRNAASNLEEHGANHAKKLYERGKR
jgi:signal peptide peptidase SppA